MKIPTSIVCVLVVAALAIEISVTQTMGWDYGHTVAQWATVVAIVGAFALWFRFKHLAAQKKLIGLCCVLPVSVHFIGLFVLSNFGGLGSGPGGI